MADLLAEFLLAIFVLGAITMVYIVLDQIYTNNLYDLALSQNVDSTNLSLVDKLWDYWPYPTLIGIVIGVALSGRIRRGNIAQV